MFKEEFPEISFSLPGPGFHGSVEEKSHHPTRYSDW